MGQYYDMMRSSSRELREGKNAEKHKKTYWRDNKKLQGSGNILDHGWPNHQAGF